MGDTRAHTRPRARQTAPRRARSAAAPRRGTTKRLKKMALVPSLQALGTQWQVSIKLLGYVKKSGKKFGGFKKKTYLCQVKT